METGDMNEADGMHETDGMHEADDQDSRHREIVYARLGWVLTS